MAQEAPIMRRQRLLAGVTLVTVLVVAGVTVGFAVAGHGRQTLVCLVVTVVGAGIFAAEVWAIKRHPIVEDPRRRD